MAIRTVGVVGAGTMGNGISQACAAAGLNAVMLDVNEAALQRGLKTISGSLDRLVRKEKLTEAQKASLRALGALEDEADEESRRPEQAAEL